MKSTRSIVMALALIAGMSLSNAHAYMYSYSHTSSYQCYTGNLWSFLGPFSNCWNDNPNPYSLSHWRHWPNHSWSFHWDHDTPSDNNTKVSEPTPILLLGAGLLGLMLVRRLRRS